MWVRQIHTWPTLTRALEAAADASPPAHTLLLSFRGILASYTMLKLIIVLKAAADVCKIHTLLFALEHLLKCANCCIDPLLAMCR